jgi:hypothetical protein
MDVSGLVAAITLFVNAILGSIDGTPPPSHAALAPQATVQQTSAPPTQPVTVSRTTVVSQSNRSTQSNTQ